MPRSQGRATPNAQDIQREMPGLIRRLRGEIADLETLRLSGDERVASSFIAVSAKPSAVELRDTRGRLVAEFGRGRLVATDRGHDGRTHYIGVRITL